MKSQVLALFLRLLAIVVFMELSTHDLIAGQRVALVVGCSKYANLPSNMQLISPAADSADVADALKAMGYTIVGGGAVKDPTREEFATAAERFASAARGAEAAVFYYSGHGIQVGEDNYLLPVDTPKITGISQLKNRAVLLRDAFMVALEEAKVPTKVVVLDCCRDNPFASQLEAVMAQVGKSIKTKSVGEITGYGPGFYLAFATSPGQTAFDGNGRRNSPFTTAFLKSLETSSNKDIDLFFRDVKKVMPPDQVSWTNSSLTDEFALGLQTVALKKADPAAQQAEVERRARELALQMTTMKRQETHSPSDTSPKDNDSQPKQVFPQSLITPPFNLTWGESSERLKRLVGSAGGHITSSRTTRGGLEAVEVTGLPQEGLEKTIFYFKIRALVGVELRYKSDAWSEKKYDEVGADLLRRISKHYGDEATNYLPFSELVLREGLKVKSIHEWRGGAGRVQLLRAMAQKGHSKDISDGEWVAVSYIAFDLKL